jgi:hypothetical protein
MTELLVIVPQRRKNKIQEISLNLKDSTSTTFDQLKIVLKTKLGTDDDRQLLEIKRDLDIAAEIYSTEKEKLIGDQLAKLNAKFPTALLGGSTLKKRTATTNYLTMFT